MVRDTDAGRLDGDRRFDRAVGPMQFLPSTWAAVAVDGDADGTRDVQDIDDAALGSAVYLCAGGGDLSTPAGARAALLRYNHSQAYVARVMAIARALRTTNLFTVVDTQPVTTRLFTAPEPSATQVSGPGGHAEAVPEHRPAARADPAARRADGEPELDTHVGADQQAHGVPDDRARPSEPDHAARPASPTLRPRRASRRAARPRAPDERVPTSSPTATPTDPPVIPDPVPDALADLTPAQIQAIDDGWLVCVGTLPEDWTLDEMRDCLAEQLDVPVDDPDLAIFLLWAVRPGPRPRPRGVLGHPLTPARRFPLDPGVAR